MAKFKVGEKARYVGSLNTGMRSHVGRECTIIDPLAVRKDYWHMAQPEVPRYGILFADGTEGWAKETSLEKLLPKHQDSDLKAAEPHFINHQLPRLLGQKEKQRDISKA